MQIKNRSNIKPIRSTCKQIQELHQSDNISISYSTVTNKSTPHKHLKMEEVYYIIKGKAKIRIGKEFFDIKPGDIIPIPKNIYHNIESVKIPIEFIVVTHPRFDDSDVIQ